MAVNKPVIVGDELLVAVIEQLQSDLDAHDAGDRRARPHIKRIQSLIAALERRRAQARKDSGWGRAEARAWGRAENQ